MVLHLYVFRHGRTKYNLQKRFTGWFDSRLTSDGIADAKKIQHQIKNKKIDVGISSDLTRALQTLKIALKDHKNTPIIKEPLIRERDYGYLDQHSKSKFEKEHPLLYKLYHRSYIISPPNGENFGMVEQRVKKFIENLKNQVYGPYQHIAISAHGNSIRAMLSILLNLKRKETEEIEIEYGRIYYLSLETV